MLETSLVMAYLENPGNSCFTLGFLCSEALANAIFFKLMHMPGGNQLFIITAVLGMIYVPFYTFRRYKLEY
jgi:hypothetical protein